MGGLGFLGSLLARGINQAVFNINQAHQVDLHFIKCRDRLLAENLVGFGPFASFDQFGHLVARRQIAHARFVHVGQHLARLRQLDRVLQKLVVFVEFSDCRGTGFA